MTLISTTVAAPDHPRLSAAQLAPAAYRAMVAFDDAVELDPTLRELVRIRASQLNGCAYCLDMHTKDARHLGEGGVPDAIWDEATQHFEGAELAQLLWAIVAINAWNRIGVATRLVPES